MSDSLNLLARDAQTSADFAAVRRAIAFAHGTGYSAAEAEAAITRLHDNHRGAVEALTTIAAMGNWPDAHVSSKDTVQATAQVARVALERLGGSS